MSGNQKQAPTVMPQSHTRYSQQQGPYLPRPPTPGRADQFHVAPQPYVQQQQQPTNQTGNQGPGPNLRGMAPTVPPTQASTPPNQDMNKVQQMQQQTPVNLGYVRQSPAPGYYRQPQPNQSTRMPQSHRQPNTVFQGAQQIYAQQTAQTQFMPIPMQSMIINSSAIYPGQINPNGNQQTRYIAPNNLPYFNQPYVHYAPPQQPQIYYAPAYTTSLQRTAHPAQVTPQQHVTGLGQQPQPQQIQAATYAPTAVQMQPAPPPPRKTKQRSHAIAIIDPSTGKQIEQETNSDQNESSSHPASGESSARQTPQPGLNQRDKQEVQAEFAKRVAQTMHEDVMRAAGVSVADSTLVTVRLRPGDDQAPHHQAPPPQQQQQQAPQQQQMHHHQQQQQQQQQQQSPTVAYHIDPQVAVAGHHNQQTYQIQQPQVMAGGGATQQYLQHHAAHAHTAMATSQDIPQQQMYTPPYTPPQEFMPRQQQQQPPLLPPPPPPPPPQQQQQQEVQVTRQPQQGSIGSSNKYQIGGDKDTYECMNETPVVSAKQGEEVTLITSSSFSKHPQRSLDSAKIIVKKPPQPPQPIVAATPTPFEEQPQVELTREDNNSVVKDTGEPPMERDAKITVSNSSKEIGVPVKEQQSLPSAVTADQTFGQQQQYRDSTSTASSVSSSNTSSSTTINNNKVRNKKDDKPVTEVPASAIAAIPHVASDFSYVQAQDNAKSKQGAQRTNKDVSKPAPQHPPPQQVVPPKAATPAPPAKVTAVAVPQTQLSKPNSKTQKLKDLNTKGATKEGTDMDVFNDINAAPPTNALEEKTANTTINSKLDVIEAENLTVPETNACNLVNVPVSINAVPDSNKKHEAPPTIKSLPKSSYNVCDIVKEQPKPLVKPFGIESKDQTDRCEVIAADNQVQSKNDTNKVAGDANNVDNKILYDKNQWAPNNTSGKKQYGRDFLMAISGRAKCKEVPDIDTMIFRDILKDGENKPHMNENLNRSYGSRSGGDFNNWTGGKSASQKGPRHGSQHKTGGGGGGGGGGKGSKIGGPMVSISVKGDVKLHECENAWKPLVRNKTTVSVEVELTEADSMTEDMYRKFRGILNKLTPQKFETLLQQVQKLVIDTEMRLKGVIDLVFEKAVDEPNFSVAYASLCAHLSTLQVPIEPESKIRDKDNKEKHVNFRKLLLNRCQFEFENNSRNEEARNNKLLEIEECPDPEKKKESLAQLEEDSRKIRLKSVGNIRFIGELFKQNMLTPNIMNSCLTNLLQDRHEDSLECLCKLLTTIGKELEKYKDKTANMDTTFNTMNDIVNKKQGQTVSSRVKFMLQDVIELRASNWVPRRQDFNPKTMDQIQKEADNEQMDIQVMNSMPPPIRNSGQPQDRNNRRGGSGASRSINEEGWSPVTNRNNRLPVFSVQSDKLKIKQPQGDERLGSIQQFNTWGRGSGGSEIKPMNAANNPIMGSATRNMYAALQSDPAPENYNRLNRNVYTSKGQSLEKYDGPSSRSGSQHRNQPNHDMSDRDTSRTQHGSMSLHMPSSTSGSSLRPQPPMSHQQQPPLPQQQQQPTPKIQPAVVVPMAAVPVAPTPPVSNIVTYPTDEGEIGKLERRLNNIVDEYNTDVCTEDDVSKELVDLVPWDCYNRFVSLGLMHVLEKSQGFRQKTGTLFAKLIISDKLLLDQYCIGLNAVLSLSPDLEIDIPKLWDYLADLILPVIFHEVLPFARLQTISKELISNNIAHKMLNALCIPIIRIKGPDYLQNAWTASGVSLSSFMPAAEVDNFVKTNNLHILVGGSQLPKINNSLNFEDMRLVFLNFFDNNASFDEICNWISANIGDRVGEKYFIRPFFTAILEHSIVTEEARKTKRLRVEVFDMHTNLIQRFISCDLNAQVQCLYATQTIINKLEHPQGLLLSIFDKLDESSSITPEAFYKWEKCDDPNENVNKGVCLKQLSAFINSMKEGDESSEEA